MRELKQDGVGDRFKSWVTFNAPILRNPLKISHIPCKQFMDFDSDTYRRLLKLRVGELGRSHVQLISYDYFKLSCWSDTQVVTFDTAVKPSLATVRGNKFEMKKQIPAPRGSAL